MTVTTRTNLATNPSAATAATNYAAVPGTSGTAAVAWNSGAGYQGIPGYPRVTWTVATSAVSGGISYTQTGLAAAVQYATQIWVRCSKAQTLNLKVDFRNGSNTIVNTVTGSNVAVLANTWTQLTVVGTSGAAVTNAVFTAQAASGGSNWANTDWLDGEAILIEATGTVGTYFDGSFVAAANVVCAWTGPTNASTSTATTYQPIITVVTKTDAPCERAEITVTDLWPGNSTVNVWRTADNKRAAVRGARRRVMVGSDFVADYEMPLGRSVSYDLEVLDGVNAQAVVTTATVTLTTAYGLLQDPLVPGSTIRVYGTIGPAGEPALMPEAVKALEYAADMSIIAIMGSPDPVAIMGQRLSAANVNFGLVTEAAQQATSLRNLIQQTPLLLLRTLPSWASGLPGLSYIASPKPVEMPINEARGGQLFEWPIKGDLVAAPTMNVLVPVWTYGAVQALWTTYQQAQTAFAGKTYLFALQDPPAI